ncbi:MAG: type II toxin-antitoxin system RelE/ParE family toxin [Thermoleophilia bacterium]|nr:type II toxin-antitoxin system RelE/ParE family toxin [Thermoleophilia bacterium]
MREFLARLDDDDASEVIAAMKDVEKHGLSVAEHLGGEIHEVKADGRRQTFRILFAPEGKHDQVLLALEGFSKKTQKTPRSKIELAKRRLREWRARGRDQGSGPA